MGDRYFDDYLPVIAIDVAVEEKTRITKMATATLHKLHNVMRQMKHWRDDSVKLKSNIWRMKMALRADDKNENDNQRIDPLIVHQSTEISRLEEANDALESEVASLKCTLEKTRENIARITTHEMGDKTARIEDEFSGAEEPTNDEIPCPGEERPKASTEEDRMNVALKQLGDKLKEFARGDRTIEMIFASAIGRIVETIVHLSEELVNVSEDLYRFKMKNKNLHMKLDRLRAMLRSRNGTSAEYRKRIDELNNLAEQLMGEMGRLKVIRGNAVCSESLDATDIPDVVRRVERLMNDLRNNLKNDREAMITAGDPDCLRYMKKAVDLKVNLKVLSVELRRSNAPIRKRSCEDRQYEKYSKITLLLNDFLNEIDVEISKLKVKSMDKYCRIGGISGSRYTTKVVELENMVKKSIAAIAVLKQQNSLEITNVTGEIIGELEVSIEQLCCRIKDLEILDDRSNLRDRIGQLESSTVQLELELAEKNDRVEALSDEYTGVRLTLENDRDKYEKIVNDIRQENESLREDVKRRKQEILELSHKREHSEQRVAEMQLMKVEIDAVRRKLRDLHDDKVTLLGETERMRDILRERDKEIEIITRRNMLKEVLSAEVKDLRLKLGIASDENVKLKSIIERLGKQKKREQLDKLKSSERRRSGGDVRNNGEEFAGSQDSARNLRDETERLRAESDESKISLNEANERIDCLMFELDKAVGDRTRLKDEISDLKSNEESLTYRLNVQTRAAEETLKEFERVMSENKALESEVKQLRNEKEQLKAELSELRSEKGLLDRSMADANNKCTALQAQVNKFKSECNVLREKISEHEAAAENLKFELEKVRAKYEDSAVKMVRIKSENSRLSNDLDALSLRDTDVEGRMRELLTEKKELSTRIGELDDENAGLRDQLNKAKAENEYFSMELNKSRVENDKVEAKNALLQITRDKKDSDNEELRKERDEMKEKLNEIGSEFGMLGNLVKIQRMKYEALRTVAVALYHENNYRKSYLKKIDTRYPPANHYEQRFMDVPNKQDYTDIAQTSIKVAIDERKDDEIEFKAESDIGTGHDNKAWIKDKTTNGEPKKPRSRNTALKSEPTNFKSENSEAALRLARARDEFQSSIAWMKHPNDEEVVSSALKKSEVINICWGKEISRYSSYSDNSKIFEDKEQSSAVGMDQLEVENRELKMEVDILRRSLNFSLMDGEKTKTDFGRTTEELEALKLELTNLRDEKVALRSRLEMFKEELNGLKSERMALKDEFAASRKSNFDLRLKANDLRNANEKLKESNAILQSRLQDVSRETNEHAAVSEVSNAGLRNNSENAIKNESQECIFVEESIRITKRRLNQFERTPAKNSRLQSVKENLPHIKKRIKRKINT